MAFFEKRVEESEMFNGRVFRVRRDRVELEGGLNAYREVVDHQGGVCILPIDSNKNVYCVKQFRYAFMQELIELPAGKLEIGETPEYCAHRELSEETGLSAASMVNLGTIYPTPGYCTEKLHLFAATGLTWGEAHPDPGEFLSVVKIPLLQMQSMIFDNTIKDAKTIAGILLYSNKMLQ